MENKQATPTTPAARAGAGRSPSYPMLSLPEAIQRIKILWEKQRKNPVSAEVAMSTLGYKAVSGTARRVVSSLIQYGLLSEEGSGANRMVRITDDGRAVAQLEPDDPQYMAAIRAAALRPKIFADMLVEWPETLPTDAQIKRHLTYDRDYNQDTVHDVIKSFRQTYEYAKLGGELGDSDDLQDGDSSDEAGSGDNSNNSSGGSHSQGRKGTGAGQREERKGPSGGYQEHTIPLTAARLAYLQIPNDLTAQDFKMLGLYLQLLQASVVTTNELPDFKILEPPKVQKGSATWRTYEADNPIVVTGYLGMKGGRHYVSIEDSDAGIPLDEVEYD